MMKRKNELWLKALRTIYSNDEITVNLNHPKTTVHLIKPATLENSYFIENFVYRGLPRKFFNLDYDTVIQHPDINGPRREGYDPMIEHENQYQNNDEMKTDSIHGSAPGSIYGRVFNSPAPSERSHLSFQNLHANQSLQESNANYILVPKHHLHIHIFQI
jgi:hypothetical protein